MAFTDTKLTGKRTQTNNPSTLSRFPSLGDRWALTDEQERKEILEAVALPDFYWTYDWEGIPRDIQDKIKAGVKGMTKVGSCPTCGEALRIMNSTGVQNHFHCQTCNCVINIAQPQMQERSENGS